MLRINLTSIALVALLIIVVAPGRALAQTSSAPAVKATLQHVVQWTEAAPSLAIAQGYTYELVIDGAAAAVPTQCAGAASPFTCQTVAFPPLSAGAHTLAVRTVDVVDGVRLEALQADAPLNIEMHLAPAAASKTTIVITATTAVTTIESAGH